jgi:hypothetical protein
MKCQKCGAELEQGVLFCKECGSKVAEKRFCRECGKELLPGAKFCSSCGADAEFIDKVSMEHSRAGNTNSQIKPESANRTSYSHGVSNTTKPNLNASKSMSFTSSKTIIVAAVVAVFVLAIFGLIFSKVKNKKEEAVTAGLTPTFTATQTDNTIELGTQYAYMSDEWNVYIASAVSDSVIKIEHWDKTMNSTKKLKYSEDIGSFKINDSENGFAWVDDDHTAFAFNLTDKGNSRVNGKSIIFTINISDTDVCKGTDYDEKIACYSYQSDDWHNYRAIPLSDKFVKIECWYRGSSLGDFLFGYDMCVLNVESNDTDFEWNADKSAFTITIADPANKSNWKDNTFVSFTLENPGYTYFSVLDFLGKGTSTKDKQQKDAFDNNTEVTVGASKILIPSYWSADVAETNHYRAYAEISGQVAMLNIMASYDDEDPVTYESLVEETESGAMSAAISTWYEDGDELNIEEFENGNIKGYIYETNCSIKGNKGFFSCLSYPDEKNNTWFYVALFETTNTEYSYTNDFRKILNSITLLNETVKVEESKTEEPKEEKAEEKAQEETKVEEKKEPEMPVFAGSSLDTAVKAAAKYGVVKQFDDDFGHGTNCMALSDSSGGLMMDITYVTATKEIMCATITTNKLATTKQQKAFVKGMASVLCPSADSNDVSSWVSSNAGSNKSTLIGGFTYEVSLGPVDNVLYYAGYNEWENWELSH